MTGMNGRMGKWANGEGGPLETEMRDAGQSVEVVG